MNPPERVIALSTPLQIATAAAALGQVESRAAAVVVTSLFARGEPAGTELVGAALPDLAVHVVSDQRQLAALIRDWDAGTAGGPSEIWSPNPHGYFTRQLLAGSSHARLTLTEDGLATQTLRLDPISRGPRFSDLGARRVPGRLGKHGLHQLSAAFAGVLNIEGRRLDRVIHFLGAPTIGPGRSVAEVRLEPASLRRAFDELAAAYRPGTMNGLGPRTALVLGEVLRGGRGTDEVVGRYVEVCGDLAAAGFEVYLKPHPRDPAGGGRIARAARNVGVEVRVAAQTSAPVEVMIRQSPETPVIGAGSAALVYGRELYGAPTFRIHGLPAPAPVRAVLVVERLLPDHRELTKR